jgi:hypothetical protein
MENKPTETRRFPRIPAEYPVLVELVGEPKAGGFAITSVVGLGGCGFVAEEAYGVNSRIKLTLSVQGKMVEAESRVVYENMMEEGKWEIGVEFTKISSFDKFEIESLFPENLQPKR